MTGDAKKRALKVKAFEKKLALPDFVSSRLLEAKGLRKRLKVIILLLGHLYGSDYYVSRWGFSSSGRCLRLFSSNYLKLIFFNRFLVKTFRQMHAIFFIRISKLLYLRFKVQKIFTTSKVSRIQCLGGENNPFLNGFRGFFLFIKLT